MADNINLDRKSGVITALSLASLVSIYAFFSWYNTKNDPKKNLKVVNGHEKVFNNEKNICILYYHFGQCLCKNIKFRFGHKSSKIQYQKNDNIIISSPRSSSSHIKKENIWERYPRSVIKSNNFDLLINEPTLHFYDILSDLNENESYKSGLYAFCNNCGTQILNLTFSNPQQIQINLDCLTIKSSMKDEEASNSNNSESENNNLSDWNVLFSSSNPNNNPNNLFHGFEGLLRASSMSMKPHHSNYPSYHNPYPYPAPGSNSSYNSYSNYPLYSISSNNSYRLRSRGTSVHTRSSIGDHRSSRIDDSDEEINNSISTSKSKKYHRRHLKSQYHSDTSSLNDGYDSFIDDTYSNYSYSSASLKSSSSRRHKNNPTLNQEYLNNVERRRSRRNSNNIQDEIMYAKQNSNRHHRNSIPLLSNAHGGNSSNSLKKQYPITDYSNSNSPQNIGNNPDGCYINSTSPSTINSHSNIQSNQTSPQYSNLNFQNNANSYSVSNENNINMTDTNNKNLGSFSSQIHPNSAYSYTYQNRHQPISPPTSQQQLFNDSQISQHQQSTSINKSNEANGNKNINIYNHTMQEHLSKHLQ